tara:strand:+ start:494 stop:829 length:336 start_codon:yes stop_codon:yes gene_type:complete
MSPSSSQVRTPVSQAEDAGSNPAGGTNRYTIDSIQMYYQCDSGKSMMSFDIFPRKTRDLINDSDYSIHRKEIIKFARMYVAGELNDEKLHLRIRSHLDHMEMMSIFKKKNF